MTFINSLINNEYPYKIVWSIIIIITGILLGKILQYFALAFYKRKNIENIPSKDSLIRVLKLGIFLISILIALSILNVSFGDEISKQFGNIGVSALIFLLFLTLGYVVITIMFDFFKIIILKFGEEYLVGLGISTTMLKIILFFLKTLIYFMLIVVSLSISGAEIPLFGNLVFSIFIAIILIISFFVVYSFKDYVANFVLSNYISKNIVRPGQTIEIDGKRGEVISIDNQGVLIDLNEEETMVIPNKKIITKTIIHQRVNKELQNFDSIVTKYQVQLPSNCGPASASIMLDFLGYKISQEKLAKESKTKFRSEKLPEGVKEEDFYGTDPIELINAVKSVTNQEVKGKLIEYSKIHNLKEEIKSWLTEGAFIILWYKKPVLFPNAKSGHYVLSIGVEDDRIVIMDPSSNTAGVYSVDYRKLESAMDKYDKSRGYMIFAKKGTPAHWRLTEGLYYINTSLYKDLSKSFERYLKRAITKNKLVKNFISPYLKKSDKEKVNHLWQPNIDHQKDKENEKK